jgi:hypothetical protein
LQRQSADRNSSHKRRPIPAAAIFFRQLQRMRAVGGPPWHPRSPIDKKQRGGVSSFSRERRESHPRLHRESTARRLFLSPSRGQERVPPPRRSSSVVHLCPRRNDADPSPPRGAVRQPGCSLLVFVPRPDAGPTDDSGAARATPSHPSTWHDERPHPRGTSRRRAAPPPAPGHGSSRQRRRRGPALYSRSRGAASPPDRLTLIDIRQPDARPTEVISAASSVFPRHGKLGGRRAPSSPPVHQAAAPRASVPSPSSCSTHLDSYFTARRSWLAPHLHP